MTARDQARTAVPALAGALAALLAGCGGSTKTLTATRTPTPGAGASAPASTTTAPTTTASTTPPPAATSSPGGDAGKSAPTHTRTAPEPQFTEEQKPGPSEGLAGALATVRAHGYSSSDPTDYHPNQTLRVLVATKSGSGDGGNQHAFFFVDGQYVGTDASAPSAQIKVLGQSDTEVTLGYALYRSSDPACCPSGGQARVRFQLNNGQLQALDPIPAVAPASGLGRR